MSQYTSFDYLGDEPFYIEGIGRVRCPTLREVRRITYNIFLVFQNMIVSDLNDYLKLHGLLERYEESSDEEKEANCLFLLYLRNETTLLLEFLNFFLYDVISFNAETVSFDIRDRDNQERFIGNLNKDNFEDFLNELKFIVGHKSEGEKKKFKNKLAEKLYLRMQEKAAKKKNHNTDFELDNMVRKFCTHNKNGINILNVWDMTYYQFITMFDEFVAGRQSDFSDMMAANSFSFKKSSDYKQNDYMKRLK